MAIVDKETVAVAVLTWFKMPYYQDRNAGTTRQQLTAAKYWKSFAAQGVTKPEFDYAADKVIDNNTTFPLPPHIMQYVREYRDRNLGKKALSLPMPVCTDEERMINLKKLRVLGRLQVALVSCSKLPGLPGLIESLGDEMAGCDLAKLERLAVIVETARVDWNMDKLTRTTFVKTVKEAFGNGIR